MTNATDTDTSAHFTCAIRACVQSALDESENAENAANEATKEADLGDREYAHTLALETLESTRKARAFADCAMALATRAGGTKAQLALAKEAEQHAENAANCASDAVEAATGDLADNAKIGAIRALYGAV